MKSAPLVPALAFLAFAVLCAGPAGAARAADPLDGTWLPQTAEMAGNKLPPAFTEGMKLVIDGEKYLVTTKEGPDAGTVKVDRSTDPKGIDIKGTEGPNKGKTIPAIFELKGDMLKVCYNLGGAERPASFETRQRTKLFLVTYQRAKP